MGHAQSRGDSIAFPDAGQWVVAGRGVGLDDHFDLWLGDDGRVVQDHVGSENTVFVQQFRRAHVVAQNALMDLWEMLVGMDLKQNALVCTER